MSAVERLKAASNKRLGYDVVQTANNMPVFSHVSTGSFVLDLALLGGVPEGLCTMFIGKQHSGKSLMALKTAGNFQKKYDGIIRPKKYVVWMNVGEGAFPTAWAAHNGVDVGDDGIIIITPTDGDAAIDLTAQAFEDEDVSAVIFDAVPGIATQKELDKSAEDALQPGSVATPLQRMLKKVSSSMAKGVVSNNPKSLIMINQWRAGIGSTPNVPRSVPGGKYARHYNSVEVELYNEEVAGEGENNMKVITHNKHSFKIHKNKVGNSIREGEFQVIRATGQALPVGTVDDFSTVCTYGQKFGFVGGAGTGWWAIDPETGEELKFKSKGLVTEYLMLNPIKYELMKRLIISALRKSQGLEENF